MKSDFRTVIYLYIYMCVRSPCSLHQVWRDCKGASSARQAPEYLLFIVRTVCLFHGVRRCLWLRILSMEQQKQYFQSLPCHGIYAESVPLQKAWNSARDGDVIEALTPVVKTTTNRKTSLLFNFMSSSAHAYVLHVSVLYRAFPRYLSLIKYHTFIP